MADELVVAIDLGTTYSAIAYVDEEGNLQIIKNADGHTTTPSVVLIRDDEVTVGQVALNQWISDEGNVVRWIKRAIGDDDYCFQGLTPVQISAEILKALRADAAQVLGAPPDKAVITCPAYFNATEIENTRAAGELAGFTVQEIIKEPTAAAVYYGLEHLQDGQTMMVCDLGGGTYDATILRYANGVFAPLASSGDRELGGHDWTMELVEMVADQLREECGEDPRNDPLASQMLYEACEQAKRDLARVPQYSISCQCGGQMREVIVTRADLENKSGWLMERVSARSEEALEKAGLSWADLDLVLLVGGSSRLRALRETLERVSGRPVQTVDQPDLAVVYGAAIVARGKVRPRRQGGLVEGARGGLVEVVFKRIISRNLGTRAINFDADPPTIENALVIPHGSEAPLTCSVSLSVAADGQEFFDVPVVEFEDEDRYDTHHNYRFACLPNCRRGDAVTVTFSYDASGIITATATDAASGQELVGERRPYEEPDPNAGGVRIQPRWVVFALDNSGSMTEDGKMDSAKQALIDNARTLIMLGGGNCKVGLVTFAYTAEIVCNPTDDIAQLERKVAGVIPFGTTAMDAGILLALQLALTAPAGVDRDVVIVTDGMPDDRESALQAGTRATSEGVTLSTLQMKSADMDVDFLKALTPLNLVIERGGEIGSGVTTLLALAQQARQGGLREAGPTGQGLRERR